MNENFEVINSTLSGRSMVLLLTSNYKLSDATDCTLLRAAMNHLYLVKDQHKKYVFRVYTHQWRTRQEIDEELRLLLHLQKGQVGIAFPIADLKGNMIQDIPAPEGLRYGVLFSYANGKKTHDFSEEMSFSIGQNMAELHRSSEKFELNRISYDQQNLLERPLEGIRRFFPNNKKETQFLEKLAKFLGNSLNMSDSKSLRKGAVHLDIWFDNMHIDADNIATFFDFDFCGNGYLVLVISYFLFQLFYTHPDKKDYESKANAMLTGYESIIQLTDRERNLLPYACLAVMIYYLNVQCDRYDYWTNIFVNDYHIIRYTDNLKRWIEYHQLKFD